MSIIPSREEGGASLRFEVVGEQGEPQEGPWNESTGQNEIEAMRAPSGLMEDPFGNRQPPVCQTSLDRIELLVIFVVLVALPP
jgi:hypothetical protein